MSEKYRVLCVDDSLPLVSALRRFIDMQPDMSALEPLPSADQLIPTIDSQKPDVVVLDASMPGADALEILSQCRERFPHVRFIVFSGYGGDDFENRAVDAGADACVAKDGEPKDLLATIRRLAQRAAP